MTYISIKTTKWLVTNLISDVQDTLTKRNKSYKILFRKLEEMKDDPTILCEWIRVLNIVEISIFSNRFIDQIKSQLKFNCRLSFVNTELILRHMET